MTGTTKPPVSEETYIRSMPFSVIKYLSVLLDIDSKWERMVVKIPKSLQDIGKADAPVRYSHIQIRLFESKGYSREGSSTRAVLDDWGTQNTKVKHLLRVLQESALFEAADYLSVNVLHGEKVPRPTATGQNMNALPQPTWTDPEKTVTGKKVCGGTDKDLINFKDSVDEKTLYKREKQTSYSGLLSDSSSNVSKEDHMYNSLMKGQCNDPPYNRLMSEGEDCKPVSYHRITSFDSGGQVSELLRNENSPDYQKAGQEHEETLQVRSFNEMSFDVLKPDREPLKENLQKQSPPAKLRESSRRGPEETSDNREPGETNDGPEETDGPMESLYMRTGSKQMEYQDLAGITDNFNIDPTTKGGRVIGTGGFGDVFLGVFKNGYKVAVKRLKDSDEVDKDKQFVSELDALVKYHHKNIVRLYAYSIDGPGKCLVYEYLCNGSLEDRLLRKDDTPPLSNAVRLSVLKGTAEGVYFLNSHGMVHRDLKSANVLLDEDFEPKVGDFATARVGPQGNKTVPMQTHTVIGTPAYLAPEAINFDVSTKLDSYSFGVVILEVLTALPAMDDKREERDIKSYVEENEICDLLDESGGVWREDVVKQLMEISEKCTEHRKKKRVNIEDIMSALFALSC